MTRNTIMKEEPAKYLQQDLEQANLNDFCKVKLTQDGVRQYRNHYYRLGLPPRQFGEHSEGVSFQLHELMRIFGSLLYFGSCKLPFEENIVTLEEKFSRKFNINDPIYVELTAEGSKKLTEQRYGTNYKTRGNLTELQFCDVANIFGPELYNGNSRLPIKTIFYFPGSNPGEPAKEVCSTIY